MRSKSRSQDLFRSMRGNVKLLVVRPPSSSYDQDLDLSQALKSCDLEEELKLNKNRLLSNSSKDSANNSGSIDRSSTGSSHSSSSSREKDDLFPAIKDENIMNKVRQKFSNNSSQSLELNSKFNQSECIYSTDSEFYYLDGKCKNIGDLFKNQGLQHQLNNNEKTEVRRGVIVDPVYEIIPEVLSEADELYCLPQDSKHVNITVSNKPDNNKSKMKSQEKLRSICRSVSSPMKMNEHLQNSKNKVKRSASSYRNAPDSADIVYTNINNLEQTMRDQQERLLSQFHPQQRPQFVAPPPPQHPPPPTLRQSSDKNKDKSFQAEHHWQWRIKVK